MTRSQKLAKLANAIRAYRGATETPHGAAKIKWKTPYDKEALKRVVKWLLHLNLDVSNSVDQIKAFKSFDELNAWLKSL